MYKKGCLFITSLVLLLLIAACGDNVEEELDVIFQSLEEDQSADTLVDLLETAHAEEPYETEVIAANNEAHNTISKLNELELTNKKAEELRDLYVSSIEDFKTIITLIETNGPDLTDEDWSQIETISEEANEKQMELIQEKFNRMDVEIPEEFKEEK